MWTNGSSSSRSTRLYDRRSCHRSGSMVRRFEPEPTATREAGHANPTSDASAAASGRPPRGWPLVGRDELLDRLVGLTIGGAQRGAVLVGRVGVGKTALAERCIEVAVECGMTARHVRATSATQRLPFGAFAALLPADHDVPTGHDLAQLLQLYATRLRHLDHDRRMILMVDDAQALDDASALLVLELARRGDVTLLVTVRRGEPAPDEVVALWKEHVLERVDVRGLEVAEIHELLVQTLQGPVDPLVTEVIARRSQGNAMFVRELVTAAREQGKLRNEGGVWGLFGWPAVSDRLADLVKAHLAKLSPDEENLLDHLAFTEPLGSLELDALGLHDAAESVERRDLVVSRLAGRRLELWLAHPLFGDVVRARLGALRRQRLARLRADLLEKTGLRRREDALMVASWRLLSGGGSSELLLAGAVSARRRHDYVLTERLANAAVDAGAGFEAKFLAAQMPSLLGRADEAETRLGALAVHETTDRERAQIAGARIDAALRSGRPAWHILDDAEATIRAQPSRDQLAAARCLLLMMTEGYRASALAAAAMVERGGPMPDQLYVVAVHNLVRLGRIAEAFALLARARADPGAGATYSAWDAELLHRTVEALLWSGRLHEAESLGAPALHTAVVEHDHIVEAYAAAALARCRLERGRPRTAVASGMEAWEVFHSYGRLLPAREPGWTTAISFAVVGDVAAATKMLDETNALPGSIAFDASRRLEVEAWIAAAAGDLRGARRRLDEAADELIRLGDLQHAATALHALVRLGYAPVAVDRLTTLASEMEGELVQARASHANALATRDAVRLEETAAQFEAMGADLYAAEAQAAATVVHRRTGRPRDAVAAARRAGTLAARCEGARTPALVGIEIRAQLTRAEVETAHLAAAGHSNREIADMLYVSVRTVENRLYKIYEKLGVSGRGSLADALRDS